MLMNWILEILLHHFRNVKNNDAIVKSNFFRILMIFDKFIKETDIQIGDENIQLWAVISIHFGIKQEIMIYPPTIDNLVQITRNNFTKEDYFKAEEILLEIMEDNMGFLTYLEVLHHYLLINSFNCLPQSNYDCFREIAETILLMVLTNFDALNIDIKVLINAVILTSLTKAFEETRKKSTKQNILLLNKDEINWKKIILNNCKVEKEFLKSIVDQIQIYINCFYQLKIRLELKHIDKCFKFNYCEDDEI